MGTEDGMSERVFLFSLKALAVVCFASAVLLPVFILGTL